MFKSIMLILIIGVCVFLVVRVVTFFAAVRNFYNVARKEFLNPGINSAFDEQGIAYDEKTNQFLFSGYMKDKTASAIYVVDPEGQRGPRKIILKTIGGKDFKGHAGGIVCYGKYVYIAGSTDDCLYVFGKDSIVNSQESVSQCVGVIPLKTSVEDGIRASFLGISDEGTLLVGEFNYGLIPQLSVRNSHKQRFKNNQTKAFLAEFKFDAEKPLGLEEKPRSVICIPDKIQGAAISNNRLVLSQSFGFSTSSILYYDYSRKNQNGTTCLLGEKVPLYCFSDPIKIVKATPLTEGIAIVRDKVFIASELDIFLPKMLYRMFAPEWCYSLKLF